MEVGFHVSLKLVHLLSLFDAPIHVSLDAAGQELLFMLLIFEQIADEQCHVLDEANGPNSALAFL